MTTTKLNNWQDEKGSALDRAKKLLLDKTYGRKREISEKADIPYQTIKNLASDPSKLDRASYNIVNKLAQMYDIYQIADSMTTEDAVAINDRINQLFSEIDLSNTKDAAMIKAIKEIVASNPNAIYYIYQKLLNV